MPVRATHVANVHLADHIAVPTLAGTPSSVGAGSHEEPLAEPLAPEMAQASCRRPHRLEACVTMEFCKCLMKNLLAELLNMSRQSLLAATLALTAVLMLGILFLFLPNGWNLIPLPLIALLLAGLADRLRLPRRTPHRASEEQPTGTVVPESADAAGPSAKTTPELGPRLNRAFGPIAAGIVIDFVDFATFGPLGLLLGLPIGGLAGYWMGRSLGLGRRAALWCALAAGVYCTIPGTEFIPLATIVGACVRFRDS